MKKNLLSVAAATLVLALSLSSCSSDDTIATTPVSLNIEMPLGISNAQIANPVVTFTNVNSGETFTASQVSLLGDVFSVSIADIPEGVYNVSIKGDLSFVKDGVAGTSKIDQTVENVSVSTSSNSLKVAVNTFTAQGGFVISELFYTGTLTAEGKQYSNDQYVVISNNSDVTLYADSIAFVESAFLTTTKQDYTPDIMRDTMSVDAIYMIPGNGKSVPVEPGKSLVLALNAKDHREANPLSFDLSHADYEFYDVSSNVNFQDEDNPNVPNLEKWYASTATYFALHNRGYKAYAIARMQGDPESYLKDFFYKATYTFTQGDFTKEMTTNAYKIPNNWVLDAVNLSVESEYKWQVTSSALDAGWTYCGKVNNDKTRYAKSVIRKKENGKWVDTNNSTNDFVPESVPSQMPATR